MPTMLKQKERSEEATVVTKKSENSLLQIPADVLLRARSTLSSLGGALKSRPAEVQHSKQRPKSSTLENFIKGKSKTRPEQLKYSKSEPEFHSDRKHQRKSRTPNREDRDYRRSRPMSVGPSPQRRLDYEDNLIRSGSYHEYFDYPQRYNSLEYMEYFHPRLVLPVQSDSLGGSDSIDGLERPRKKLSFREPEIVSESSNAGNSRYLKHMGVKRPSRNTRISLTPEWNPPYDNNADSDLESQAMHIVRTVGEAFEVCHKLSTNTSEPTASCSNTEEPVPSVTVVSVEQPKKEFSTSEAGGSSSAGEASTSAVIEKLEKPAVRPQKLDLLPPPPRKENRRSPKRSLPTPAISFPELPECVTNVEPLPAPSSSDVASTSVLSSTPLSAQHELQLLKERLDQQSQQTRAAVAQLLLLRDQLAAEQAARCEAQARTHQLLVHNKELLDHITALVAHLQERERGSRHTPISVQQLTMVPQQVTKTTPKGNAVSVHPNQIPNDNAAILELLVQSSPITAGTSASNLQNNNFSPFAGSSTTSTPANVPPNAFPLNNNITTEQFIAQFQNLSTQPTKTPFNCNQQYFQNSSAFPHIPPLVNHYTNLDLERLIQENQVFTSSDMNVQSPNSSVSQSSTFSPSPAPTSKDSTSDSVSSDESTHFIMPLSHSTTLTTTDMDGRVRLIVPVSPSGSTSDFGESYVNNNESANDNVSMVTLDITDERGNTRRALPAVSAITRTTSEKVPNRSEMMATMRAQWTRHTTK